MCIGNSSSFLVSDTVSESASRLTRAHTGEYLAQKNAECLLEYNLLDSILSTTLDNASNNDAMLKELPLLLPEAPTLGTDYHIRCFGHVLNLAVKAFLSLFDYSAKARKADRVDDEGDDNDNDEGSDADSDVDSPDEDADEFEEDEAAERDTGDWEEIAELTKSLKEVKDLGPEDKMVGRTTMKKVDGCIFFMDLTNVALF